MNLVTQAANAKTSEMETAKYLLGDAHSQFRHKKSCRRKFVKSQKVHIDFVKNSGINGTYQTNLFQFEHFNMDHITLGVGATSIPGKALQPDF